MRIDLDTELRKLMDDINKVYEKLAKLRSDIKKAP